MAFGAEMDRQDGSFFNVEAVAFLLKARADQVVQRGFIVFLPCQNHVGLTKRTFHLFHRFCTSLLLLCILQSGGLFEFRIADPAGLVNQRRFWNRSEHKTQLMDVLHQRGVFAAWRIPLKHEDAVADEPDFFDKNSDGVTERTELERNFLLRTEKIGRAS